MKMLASLWTFRFAFEKDLKKKQKQKEYCKAFSVKTTRLLDCLGIVRGLKNSLYLSSSGSKASFHLHEF